MPRYTTIQELADAYAAGDVPREAKLVIDNDSLSVWNFDEVLFEAHPSEALEQLLTMAGIPWEGA